MTVSIIPSIDMTAVRTFSSDAADDVTVIQNKFNLSGTRLTAGTTPPVTVESYQEYTLSAGAKTIDLTALLDFADVAQNCTGLKVQTFIFVNPAGNSAMNIAPGASNPYPLFGAANDITVPGFASQDCTIGFYFPEGCPDVASGVKTIDVTGTGTQKFKLGLCLG